MLTTITIIMILVNLFIFNRTIRTILAVQEHQYNINKDLRNNIEVLDKRTTQISGSTVLCCHSRSIFRN